jgi:four helix bundle protein
MANFAFRRMPVYQQSQQLAAELSGLAQSLGRNQWRAADQLIRAVLSIMLNIAEGSGEFRPLEKARFYRMARRSCFETAAALDHLVSINALAAEVAAKHSTTLEQITESLTALIRSMESRSTASDPVHPGSAQSPQVPRRARTPNGSRPELAPKARRPEPAE